MEPVGNGVYHQVEFINRRIWNKWVGGFYTGTSTLLYYRLLYTNASLNSQSVSDQN